MIFQIEVEYDATKEEMYMLEKRRLQLQGDKKKILKVGVNYYDLNA